MSPCSSQGTRGVSRSPVSLLISPTSCTLGLRHGTTQACSTVIELPTFHLFKTEHYRPPPPSLTSPPLWTHLLPARARVGGAGAEPACPIGAQWGSGGSVSVPGARGWREPGPQEAEKLEQAITGGKPGCQPCCSSAVHYQDPSSSNSSHSSCPSSGRGQSRLLQ